MSRPSRSTPNGHSMSGMMSDSDMDDLDQASAEDAGSSTSSRWSSTTRALSTWPRPRSTRARTPTRHDGESNRVRARPSRSPRCRTCSRPSKPRRIAAGSPLPAAAHDRPHPLLPADSCSGHPTSRPAGHHHSWSLSVPQQHPQTPTSPAPLTRREALAAERAAAAPTPPHSSHGDHRRFSAGAAAATDRDLSHRQRRPVAAVTRSRRGPDHRAAGRDGVVHRCRSAARAGNDRPRSRRTRCRSHHRRAELHRVRAGSRGRPRRIHDHQARPEARHTQDRTRPSDDVDELNCIVEAERPATTGGTIVNTGTGDIRWPVAAPSRSAHRSARAAHRARPAHPCTRARTSPPAPAPPIGAVAAGTVRVSTTHPRIRAVRHHRPPDRTDSSSPPSTHT